MGFIEWFKSKPYWLRGGIILLIIDSLLVIPILISCLVLGGDNCTGAGYALLFTQLPFVILARPFLLLFSRIQSFNVGSLLVVPELFAMGFVGLIGYFVTGAIIGLIFGKIVEKYKGKRTE